MTIDDVIEKLEALRVEAEYMSDRADTEEDENIYAGRESAFAECIKILLGE